jgi:L-iditol 2-dehydrogenase
MKAVVLRGRQDLALEDVERPRCGREQVLVRVTNSGVCGTDLKIYDGSIPVRYPLIMGHEISGEVVEGGDDRIRVGDRVLIDPCLSCGQCVNCRLGQTNLCGTGGLVGRDLNGGFAEYFLAPLTQVYALPEAVESEKAPLIQVLTTCIHAQRSLNIFPGQSVVVIGLGVTGQLHVQLAKAHGAHPVVGVTRSAWKKQLATELGADLTLASGTEAVRGVWEATSGRGADVVIVSTDALPAIADGISMCRPGATFSLFAVTTATQNNLPLYQLYYKELRIFNSRAARPEDFAVAIGLVARGVVKLDPLVTHTLPLAKLPSAMQMLEADVDHRMKIILNHN